MIPMTLAIPAPIPSPFVLHAGLAPVVVAVIALLAIAAAATLSVLSARRGARGTGLHVLPSPTRSPRAEQRPLAA